MKNPTCWLLFLAASVATAAGAQDPGLERQIHEVRCAEIAFSDALEAGDWDAFEDAIYREARFVGRTTLVGPKAITEAWRERFSDPGRSVRWRPRTVEILKEGVALSRGPAKFTRLEEDGSETESWGNFNSIWVMDGDRWRVTFDIGSPADETLLEQDRELLQQEATDCP